MIITFDEYQAYTCDTATPESQTAEYLYDGLISEAGEVIGKYAKRVRADYTEAQFRQEVKAELGDVCWFVAQIALQKKLRLSAIAYKENISDFLVAPLLTNNINYMHPRYELLRHSLMLAEIEFSDVAPTPEDFKFSISHGLKLVMANVLRIAEENQLTLQSIMSANIGKLAERKKNGKIKGDGDKR